MATRSRIGIENEHGTIRSIYCHWDGYPSGVGKTLQTHYMDRDKVEALLSLGNISELGDSIETTVAYARDRGEDAKDNFYREDLDINSFKRKLKASDQDWAYIMGPNGQWKIFGAGAQ